MREFDILKFLFDNRGRGRVDLLSFFIAQIPNPSEFDLKDASSMLNDLFDNKGFIEISYSAYKNFGSRVLFHHPNGAGSETKECLSFQDLADLKALGYINKQEMEARIKKPELRR